RPSLPKPSPKAPVPKKPVPIKNKAVPQKVLGQEKRVTEPQKKGTRYVTIDFDNVDIALFIKFISELTGKNFVIDKAVKGKVTIISPTKITTKEAYKVFESVLEVHGYTTVPAGSIIKIVPAVQARSKNIKTLLRKEAITPEDRVVTQLIPLKYADPNELKKLFTPLISKSSIMVSYPPTGMLMVTDVLSNIKRLLHIIEAIDVPGIGEELSVVPLQHAAALDMGKSLNAVFQRRVRAVKKGVPGGGPVIKIVPDERTNVLIILASEDDSLKVKELIKLLDKETPRGEGDIHVYYLQNANAEDLAKVLTAIPGKQKKVTIKGRAPVISKEVQIVADKATNSLVITAKRDDFLVLEDVIKKLDIPRRMVYIEALLMEVSVNKQFDLGVEWAAAEQIGTYEGKKIGAFGGSRAGPVLFPSVITTGETASIQFQPGFSLGVLGEAITIGGINFPTIRAVMRAFEGDSDVYILSHPQIMTTDNEEAEIKVVENRPFLTRQERSSTSAGIDYSSYEFKDVGVTLNIIPQINQERFVRLKISQEVSQVVEQEEIGLPTTLKRTAETTVIVKDGHTVVIGGMIAETLNKINSQVPCLGNITGLGWLFRSVSEGADRKNLYIFLTPHIIENPVEAQKVYEEKKEKIEKIREGVIKMYEGRRKETEDTEKKGVADE
ncbi:MAG: type II secretion system secretin GspD, partial [Deltaproteobacteria bacterium]|nr:type II secretion system secretin GspD [Deltaproteobacteria bacterium]